MKAKKKWKQLLKKAKDPRGASDFGGATVR
jgi:hypothetical protein